MIDQLNRQTRRNIEKVKRKYPEEIRYIVIDILDNVLKGIANDTYKVLRDNRVGQERAEKITDEIIETMRSKEANK